MAERPTGTSTLVAREIARLPRYLYAAPSYLKQAAPLEHPNDLTGHVLFVGQGATKQPSVVRTLYRADEKTDITVASRFVINSVSLSRALAVLGVGIAALDTELTRDGVAAGRLCRVLAGWSLAPVQVHAITETRLLPARTRLFIDFLKRRLQELSVAPQYPRANHDK